MRKKILFKIIISIIILTLLIYKLDYRTVFENLKMFPILGIFLLVIDYFVTVFFNAISLFILLSPIHKKLRFFEFLRISWHAFSIGQFSPGRSGELSILYFLKKRVGFPMGRTLVAVLIFKLTTFFVLLLFAIVTLKIYFYSFKIYLLMWGLILMLFIILIFYLAHYTQFLYILIKKFLPKNYPIKLISFFQEFKDTLQKKRLIFSLLVLNTVKLGYNALTVILISYLINQKFPLLLIMGINALVMLSIFIPVSFAGIGIKESLATLLLSQIGFNAILVASIYIVYTIVYLVMNSFMFLYFIYKN